MLKILNFVKKIHYYSKLFTSLLKAREQDAELQTEARRSAGRTLESTERLLQSQRSVAQNGASKAQDLAQRLDAFPEQ